MNRIMSRTHDFELISKLMNVIQEHQESNDDGKAVKSLKLDYDKDTKFISGYTLEWKYFKKKQNDKSI
jgi:hypothetical protein